MKKNATGGSASMEVERKPRSLRMTHAQLARLFSGTELQLPMHATLRVKLQGVEQEAQVLIQSLGPHSARLLVEDASALPALSCSGGQAYTIGLRLAATDPAPLLHMDLKPCARSFWRQQAPGSGAAAAPAVHATANSLPGQIAPQANPAAEAPDESPPESSRNKTSAQELGLPLAQLTSLLGGKLPKLPMTAKLHIAAGGQVHQREARVYQNPGTGLVTMRWKDGHVHLPRSSTKTRSWTLLSAGSVPLLRVNITPLATSMRQARKRLAASATDGSHVARLPGSQQDFGNRTEQEEEADEEQLSDVEMREASDIEMQLASQVSSEAAPSRVLTAPGVAGVQDLASGSRGSAAKRQRSSPPGAAAAASAKAASKQTTSSASPPPHSSSSGAGPPPSAPPSSAPAPRRPRGRPKKSVNQSAPASAPATSAPDPPRRPRGRPRKSSSAAPPPLPRGDGDAGPGQLVTTATPTAAAAAPVVAVAAAATVTTVQSGAVVTGPVQTMAAPTAAACALPAGPACGWSMQQVASWLHAIGEQGLVEGFLHYEMDGSALHGLYFVGEKCGFGALVAKLVEMCGNVSAESQGNLWGRMVELFVE